MAAIDSWRAFAAQCGAQPGAGSPSITKIAPSSGRLPSSRALFEMDVR